MSARVFEAFSAVVSYCDSLVSLLGDGRRGDRSAVLRFGAFQPGQVSEIKLRKKRETARAGGKTKKQSVQKWAKPEKYMV